MIYLDLIKDLIKKKLYKIIRRDYVLVLMCIPGVLVVFLFRYLPMYGVTLAFKRYIPAEGIWGGQWVGTKYFEEFLRDPFLWRIVRNTILLNVFGLLWGFPMPIILALLLNEVRVNWFKRSIQTVTYLPYFVSSVILIGIMMDMLSPYNGIVNDLLAALGFKKIYFFGEAKWFRTLYIAAGIWQNMGYNSIIYLAAIAGINPELYESATIDGANRLQKIRYITIPGILPTATILLILSMGGLLGSDTAKILLMYSPATYETSDVISTYVFRAGIQDARISFGTAVGLLTATVAFAFVFTANYLSRKVGETSLW